MQSGLSDPLRATSALNLRGSAATRVLFVDNVTQPCILSPALADSASIVRVASQDLAWENLLLDTTFDAVVCNVGAAQLESLSLISAMRSSATRRIAKLAIFTVVPATENAPDKPHAAATDWIKLGSNGHFAGSDVIESLRVALYSPKAMPLGEAALTASTTIVPEEMSVPKPPASQAVQDWLDSRFVADDGWLILHGVLEQKVQGAVSPRRPSRLAMLQQYLRKGDELLVEDERCFWVAVRLNDELLGARLALRMALKLMRSTDPGRLPIAVAISGMHLTSDSRTTTELCRRNLPSTEHAGDVSIAIDRWRFCLPIRVAQSLLLG